MTIEWRPVPGLEDRYDVSNNGQIRSYRYRKGMVRKEGRYQEKKLHKSSLGYVQTKLWDGERNFTALVHRLVVEAFIGPIPPGMNINHIDHDKENNHVSNLEIVTQKQNIRRAIDAGIHIGGNTDIRRYGHANALSVLTDLQVLWLRKMFESGYTYTKLSEIFNISSVQVGRIVRCEHRAEISIDAQRQFKRHAA